MRKARLTLLRIFFVLVFILGAIQLTGAEANANNDFCLLNYISDWYSCGALENCQPGDYQCEWRNSLTQACMDAADTKYARCIGWID
jgi:hypothetical protein